MADTESTTWPAYVCRDEALIPADADAVWAVLADLATWVHWWTLIGIVPLDPDASTTVVPGLRFRVTNDPLDAPEARGWNVEVREVVPRTRIDLEYTDGDLVGPTSWELTEAAGGTNVAYVYHGVRPTNAESFQTFEHHGTALHSVAVQVDLLAGLARYVRGEPIDDAWRAEVQAAMASGVAALP